MEEVAWLFRLSSKNRNALQGLMIGSRDCGYFVKKYVLIWPIPTGK